jgi:hypothetical protein
MWAKKKEERSFMPSPKKTNARLTVEDVVSLIAKGSDLTKDQVTECFRGYANLYISLMESDNTPSDFTIPLPYIGTFKLKKYQGKKKGSTYKIGDFRTGEMRTVVVEEDQPDFNLPYFVVKPAIRESRKDASKRRWIKEHKNG